MMRLVKISLSLVVLFSPALLLAQVPTFTSLSRTSGPVGASVTVTGTNFGSAQGASIVTFNGTMLVPTGATTGNPVVRLGGQASYGVLFTVTASTSNGMFRRNWPAIHSGPADISTQSAWAGIRCAMSHQAV
jgi:hypothetical protein